MGIPLSTIERMQSIGLFAKGGASVLDIGSSNLYSAPAVGIERFLRSQGVVATPETAAFAEKLAKGSAYDGVEGGTNGAFVGELFEKAGMKYAAVDIADGYRTTILDLNHAPAPQDFVGAFDVVLNFGTTEHLLNQYNAFRVMHDSTKVGGYIVHSLPGAGYSNHGYFTYTPRCFFDIAGYNEYEVAGFWFDGPAGGNDLYDPVRDYLSYFPNLSKTLADRQETESGRKIAALNIPDVGIMVVYRKVKARPFMGALERSTSVGNVPGAVTSAYEPAYGAPAMRVAAAGATRRLRSIARRLLSAAGGNRSSTGRDLGPLDRHEEIGLEGEARDLRERFVAGRLNVDLCHRFYEFVVQACGHFPYDWEERILLLGLEREPGRTDLAERLVLVRGYIASGIKAAPGR